MSSSIRIENLHYVVSEADLFEIAQTYGNVTKTQIQYDRAGRSDGAATVRFSSAHEAALAAESLNGMMLDGQVLTVYVERPRQNSRKVYGSTPQQPEPLYAEPYARDTRSGGRSVTARASVTSRLGPKNGGGTKKGGQTGVLARLGPVRVSVLDRLSARKEPVSGGGGQLKGGRRSGRKKKATANEMDVEMDSYMNGETIEGNAHQKDLDAPAGSGGRALLNYGDVSVVSGV
ncbi:hypothetical protein HK101_003487 [Irineochytrium annulatum]|nr:hypothetical protein HK101_003487 [Irineochytrium annulatum]